MDKSREEIYRESEVRYDQFKGRFNINDLVESVGFWFTSGMFLGFPYHLIKGGGASAGGGGMPIISRLHGAAMKSTRLGGFLSLLAIWDEVLAYPICELRGEETLTRPEDIVASNAACGAIVMARRGLLPASATALAIAAFTASMLAIEARYKPKKSDINTYTYPHYRPPHQRILAYPDL